MMGPRRRAAVELITRSAETVAVAGLALLIVAGCCEAGGEPMGRSDEEAADWLHDPNTPDGPGSDRA